MKRYQLLALAGVDGDDHRFDILAGHDAEDLIHPLELRLFNYLIPEYDFVQTPVLPLELRPSQLVAGTYLDELDHLRLPPDTVRVEPRRVYVALRQLYDHSALYNQTGGVDTSVMVDPTSPAELLSGIRAVGEDIVFCRLSGAERQQRRRPPPVSGDCDRIGWRAGKPPGGQAIEQPIGIRGFFRQRQAETVEGRFTISLPHRHAGACRGLRLRQCRAHG